MRREVGNSRWRWFATVFVTAALLLTACSSDSGDTTAAPDTTAATNTTAATDGSAAPDTTAATETTVAAGPETKNPQDPNAELLVWTDVTRQAVVDAYVAANPDQKIKVELVESSQLVGKIQLANQAGSGLPDLAFGGPESIAPLRTEQFGSFALDISPYLADGLDEEYGGGLDICRIDGGVLCLRNDLAQTVLWYNAALMEEFGYTVPTTMEEFRALGESVAAEHPGYVLGAVGENFIWFDFFWSSGCPLSDVRDDFTVNINALAPECTRVADILDPMIANGSVLTLSVFDPAFIAMGNENKILMLLQPSWFGEFMFKGTFQTPEGELAAAETPTWSGEDTAWAGNGGGGIWIVGSASKNIQAAVDMVTWLSTSLDVQVPAATYPAYAPAATAWGATISADAYYAEDPFPVLEAAAAKVNPIQKPTRYDVSNAIEASVIESITGGGTIAESLERLQAELVNAATITGYAVLTE